MRRAGLLPSLQHTFSQWSTHEAGGQAGSGLQVWLLPEHGEFLNCETRQAFERDPGTLS